LSGLDTVDLLSAFGFTFGSETGWSAVAQTTQVTQSELDAAAKRFEEVNSELQGMLKTLMSELESMRQQWQGAGGRSFEAVKVAWSGDLDRLNTNLLETAAGIKSSGHNYDATDTEASHLMNATRSGGRVLPL
jgi:WXG100 family type VII secretion target